jgi:hypothetical protein
MAKVIARESGFVKKEELHLFGLPPTQVAAERSRWLTVYPKNTVPENDISTPITFELSGIPDYLDLHKNLLKTKFQIKNNDGTALAADVNVAPINYIANTFIKQVKIFMNNQLIFDSQDTYMHRAYIETLLNATTDVKTTQLQLAGWYKDDYAPGHETIDHASNPGFIERKELASESKTFEVLGELHTDLFNQHRYMLPNIKLRIELYRNSPSVTLHAIGLGQDVNYSLHIKNIEFNVRVVELNKSFALAIEKNLMKMNANYILRRVMVKTIPISIGTKDLRNLEIFNGQLPTGMLLTLLSSDPYHGNIAYSPFNYNPYDIQSIQALVGGRRWPAEKPLEINITRNEITEAYYQFFNNCSFWGSLRETNGITMKDYKRHSFFLAFDFRSDEKNEDAVDLINHGETRVFMKFGTPLPKDIHLIAYLTFDNILRIDSGRNPILDYSI